MSHSADIGMLKYALIFITLTTLMLTFSGYIPADKSAILSLTDDQIDTVTTPTSDYLVLINRMLILATIQPEFSILSLLIIPMGLIFLVVVAIIIRGFLL